MLPPAHSVADAAALADSTGLTATVTVVCAVQWPGAAELSVTVKVYRFVVPGGGVAVGFAMVALFKYVAGDQL
jgi:hypothetical protein